MSYEYALVLAKALSMIGLLGMVAATVETTPLTPDEKTEIVDSQRQATIIDSVIAAYEKHYLYADVVGKIKSYLLERFEQGAYAKFTRITDFTDALMQDLQKASGDAHAYVLYIRERDPVLFEHKRLTPEEQESAARKSAYKNHGFHKLERLEGNIGYIDLREFCHPSYAGATAHAAMDFLSNCDAIIFDLRQNGGGEGEMGNLLSTYFFAHQEHLNDIVYANRTKQDWTDAHVSGKRMPEIPLYILMSSRSFSAAEGFTFGLQNRKRAIVIGEKTRGGGHQIESVFYPELHITVCVPTCETRNPQTGATFEAIGIIPDIAVPQEQALTVAYSDALTRILEQTTDESKRQSLIWVKETIDALEGRTHIDIKKAQEYTGTYGARSVFLKDGQLYYHREGNPRYALIPMSQDLFVISEQRDFRVKFLADSSGKIAELATLYADGTSRVYRKTTE